MRVLGRIVLFGLAIIGLIASVAVLVSWAIGPGDPLDRTRVTAVVPAPSQRQAAVLYLHHVSNFSSDILAVKLVEPPFPAPGARMRPADNIAAVAHGSISGWSSINPGASDTARQLVRITWSAGTVETVDICPANGAKLVAFDTHYARDDVEGVTLCQKAKE